MTTICPECSSAVPQGSSCELCGLAVEMVAALEVYLARWAAFELYCELRDARDARRSWQGRQRRSPEPEVETCAGAVCLYRHGCPGGCRFRDTYPLP